MWTVSLEHDRVYCFENGGDKQVWLSSADWMTRNIDYRIEVAAPLLDPRLKQRVLDIFDILFNDTVKARYLDKELSNRYVPRGNRRKVRANGDLRLSQIHSNNPTNLCQ
ncbi:hypothetical protein LNO89_24520 [Klebsiella pneumoniae subsp. pneumoniae]|nr:hypothetical protein [Klebsiella pneumoniae subsp. pneumoniae]